jgi:hypothetical protein
MKDLVDRRAQRAVPSTGSFSRRQMLAAAPPAAMFACSMCAGRAVGALRQRRYCSDSTSQVSLSNALLLQDFTRPGIVVWIKREDTHLSNYFGVVNDILIDIGSSDAFMDGVHNRIVLGDRYIDRFANPSAQYGLLRITGVLAHEKSHLFQVAVNMDGMLSDVSGEPVKYVELHADYMAGAYIAWRERRGIDSAPQALGAFFFLLGDRAIGSERHHGTEVERRKAFEAGYGEAREGEDVKRAAAKGLLYVRRTI